jgi:hypothetical protein
VALAVLLSQTTGDSGFYVEIVVYNSYYGLLVALDLIFFIVSLLRKLNLNVCTDHANKSNVWALATYATLANVAKRHGTLGDSAQQQTV